MRNSLSKTAVTGLFLAGLGLAKNANAHPLESQEEHVHATEELSLTEMSIEQRAQVFNTELNTTIRAVFMDQSGDHSIDLLFDPTLVETVEFCPEELNSNLTFPTGEWLRENLADFYVASEKKNSQAALRHIKEFIEKDLSTEGADQECSDTVLVFPGTPEQLTVREIEKEDIVQYEVTAQNSRPKTVDSLLPVGHYMQSVLSQRATTTESEEEKDTYIENHLTAKTSKYLAQIEENPENTINGRAKQVAKVLRAQFPHQYVEKDGDQLVMHYLTRELTITLQEDGSYLVVGSDMAEVDLEAFKINQALIEEQRAERAKIVEMRKQSAGICGAEVVDHQGEDFWQGSLDVDYKICDEVESELPPLPVASNSFYPTIAVAPYSEDHFHTLEDLLFHMDTRYYRYFETTSAIQF